MKIRVIRFSALYKPSMASLKAQLEVLTVSEGTVPGTISGQTITIKSGMKLALDHHHPFARYVAVAHENGVAVGWAVTFGTVDPDFPLEPEADSYGQARSMVMIYVRPDLRRRKIGSLLIKSMRRYEPALTPSTGHAFFHAVGVGI